MLLTSTLESECLSVSSYLFKFSVLFLLSRIGRLIHLGQENSSQFKALSLGRGLNASKGKSVYFICCFSSKWS